MSHPDYAASSYATVPLLYLPTETRVSENQKDISIIKEVVLDDGITLINLDVDLNQKEVSKQCGSADFIFQVPQLCTVLITSP